MVVVVVARVTHLERVDIKTGESSDRDALTLQSPCDGKNSSNS